MNTSVGPAAERSADAPKVRARIARALRGFSKVRGWRSLVNRLVPRHAAPFVVTNSNTLFAGDLESFVDREVYLFGGYEVPLIDTFISCVPKHRRGVVLDIGANVGTHSLAFAREFEAVHSFEPNPMLWHQFERNMELNKLGNVRLHRLGLADVDAELTLHLIDKANYGLGTFSTADQYDLPLRAVATCPIRHAGKYLSEIATGSIDAVKIDVQGFEPEVLVGLRDVLERDRPVIWCEIGAGTRAKMETTADLQKLLPFAFRCLRLEPRGRWRGEAIRPRERTGDLPAGDYILIPE